LRFFEGKTQMEVADEIGISQAQVSRLEKSALKEIKKHVISHCVTTVLMLWSSGM
jgi:RNA polymerase sporulation-specific sigma factor